MIRQIDHLAIAVSDPTPALRFFLEVLGGRQVWSAPMPGQGFRWTTIELGASCLVELINPEGEPDEKAAGFVQRYLDKRGPGVHHLTIQVDDLAAVREALDAAGIPHFGYGEPLPGWKEMFVHPRDAFGVLLQFAEFDPFAWIEPGAPIPAPYARFAPPGAADQPLEVQREARGDADTVVIHCNGAQLRLSPAEAGQLKDRLEAILGPDPDPT